MAGRAPIMLITPNWRWDETPLPTDTLRAPLGTPLEMAYISAGLDCEHHYIDAYAADLTPGELAREVERFAPASVVISTAASLLYWRCPAFSIDAVTLAVEASRRSCGAEIIIIGPHASFSPEWVLTRTGADACWLGAVERDFPRWLASGQRDSPHVHRDGAAAEICVEHPASLPAARMSIFDFTLPYVPHMWCVTERERTIAADQRIGALAESSRGCPFSCVYCAKAPIRDKFARRPSAVLAQEWEQLVELGIDYVFFIDETFNLGPRRLDDLLDTLQELPLRFGFQGRPELISAQQAERLAAAGCVYAELGVDVGTSALSEDLGRGQSVDDAREGIERCRAAIPIVRYNRLNLSTLDYRSRLGITDDGWDYPPDPAYPYPGAPLGELVMRLYGREGFDWEFALRYSWWLRIEVALQRSGDPPDDQTLAAQQANFLSLPHAEAHALAQSMDGIQHDAQFQVANKYVRGAPA
jgi:anaerobic magnesium-protoporphyrin IX monomethyl ester cyclase